MKVDQKGPSHMMYTIKEWSIQMKPSIAAISYLKTEVKFIDV